MKTGIDIEDVSRIEKLLTKNEDKLERIFTSDEILYCKNFGKGCYIRFTGFYCAKEAFSKALGTGFSNGVKFAEIEICHNKFGAPEISEKTIEKFCPNCKVSLSISHTNTLATAICVLN